MAKMVGLSRNLKLQWLNKTVELVIGGFNKDQIKEQLNEYLAFEITSPTNLRKTREILMNVWVYDNDESDKLKEQALKLIQDHPDYSLEIHWCMLMSAYQVFTDVCTIIGKISEFQDEISLAQIKQKVFDDWGERTTLLHSVDKLIATLREFNVLGSNKRGKYNIKKHKVDNVDVVAFMIYSLMHIDGGGYYSLMDLKGHPCFFPFDYEVGREPLINDNRFMMNNFGGDLSISLSMGNN